MTDPDTTNVPRFPEPEKAAAAIPQFGLGDQLAYQQYQRRTRNLLWGVFALLLVLAAGVFFVLPNFVAPPDGAERIVVVAPEQPAAGTTVAAMSPFEEAQRLRQRETAQNTLSALLDLQESLEQQNVQGWAGAEFAQAIESATQGDTAYREQRFTDANALYQSGLDIMKGLSEGQDQRYLDLVANGNDALMRGAASSADEAFTLALLLRPNGAEAVSGKQRAGVLTEVLALLEQGQEQHESGNLNAAKTLYQQALALDSQHPETNTALRQVNSDIEQHAYSEVMSRGYAALQNNDPQAAELAFRDAQALRPDAEDVKVALQQTADQLTTTIINRHMDAARMHEANEAWSAALEEWTAALAIDPNLVVADRGKQRTATRLELDTFFSEVIRDPLQLVEEEIHTQTRQLLIDIQQISSPGPRLREQIVAVQALMEKARVPVTVHFQSDGMTTVTVYRVGALGLFQSHSQDLLPGRYVAVGVRPGYRDVRAEFTVNIGAEAVPVTVMCSEKI